MSKLSAQSWSSQTMFILAAIGSAVGLGNIWRFPYIVGENGGGAFVLVYLLCIFFIGLPILWSEIALGRAGKANPVNAMLNLAQEAKASKGWAVIGFSGIIASILILSFYSAIAGLIVAYFVKSLSGDFANLSPSMAEGMFSGLLSDAGSMVFWHSLVIFLTLGIVAGGVKAGLEKAISIMMPGLFVILLVLLVYAASTGYFSASFSYMFYPDFSALSWSGVLIALGQAFFSLSLGLGAMMAYGSYVGRGASLIKSGLWIVGMDTLIAIMAGLVIFSIVFANGMAPNQGVGLLFQTLPVAFAQMPFGEVFASLFFAFVILAALSSTISLLEPGVGWLGQTFGLGRKASVWFLGGIAWILGLGTVLSFNLWAEFKLVGELNFFGFVEFVATNVLLPLGGLLIGIFTAWVLPKAIRERELPVAGWANALFLFTLRFITPFAILWVFIGGL